MRHLLPAANCGKGKEGLTAKSNSVRQYYIAQSKPVNEPPFRAVPVKQEKIKSPDFRGEYGVTLVTPFLFASISLAE